MTERNNTATDARFRTCYRPNGRREAITNMQIREALQKYGLCLHQLAEVLEIHKETLSRMLRHELPEDQQREIVNMIRKEVEEK